MNQSVIEWREGGCHCGKIRFRVRAKFDEALSCNCSMCDKTGFLHLIVAKEDFEFSQGREDLTLYQFNQKIAKHLFCRLCGVKSFYVPRSHPDGYSVNIRCVDGIDLLTVRITPFDGRNWESSVERIR